jgi:integrase
VARVRAGPRRQHAQHVPLRVEQACAPAPRGVPTPRPAATRVRSLQSRAEGRGRRRPDRHQDAHDAAERLLLRGLVGWVPANPVQAIRKPPQRSARRSEPLPPVEVEEIRTRLLMAGRPRDALLVSVLAYAGLRPGEALALRWSVVGERTLRVRSALALGTEKTTKTNRDRSVRLLPPLHDDLSAYRATHGPPLDPPVFPTGAGSLWQDHDWRNWRRRVSSRSQPPSVDPTRGPMTCATRSSDS